MNTFTVSRLQPIDERGYILYVVKTSPTRLTKVLNDLSLCAKGNSYMRVLQRDIDNI